MSEEQETLPVEVEFAGIRSRLVKTSYVHADAMALLVVDAADGSPVTTASINVPGVSETLPEDRFVLKSYSENEGLLEALVEAGIVEDTGRRVPTGFVANPLVRLLVG